MIPESILERLTPAQASALRAVQEHGGKDTAARAMGRDARSFRRLVKRAEAVAADLGWSPEHGLVKPAAPGFGQTGYTRLTTFDENGGERVSMQYDMYRKSAQEQLAMMREAAEAMAEELPEIQVREGPKDAKTDVIPWINIGDAHIGLVAHEAEVGANFDLKIAERELCKAIAMLIEETGEHERVVINDCGDATHYENFAGVTEASGHPLDYDGRFPKMIKVYARIMRFIVEKALEKFQFVDVIVNQGNHSRTNDIWMAEYLRAVYGHTGRVNVLNNDSVFIAYRMGKTFVMTHHSDKCKPDRLANVMATDYAKDWGESEYRYIDIGHIHHRMTSKEHPGVMIESFNILANPDKYAHDNGYRSRQSITIIKRSRKYGEIGRRVLPIQEVRDAIRAECTGKPDYEPKPKMAYSV